MVDVFACRVSESFGRYARWIGSHHGVLVGVLALLLGWGSVVPPTFAAERTLHGEVILIDGPALPAGAVLDVYLEDQSRADTKAGILAQTQLIPSGPPPYAFTLSVDPSTLDARGRYGLRARISVQEQLWYINTRHVPAFDGAADGSVTVPVEPVGVAKRPGTAFFAPLPAMFVGDLGCQGCAPTAHTLELDAAGHFVYRTERLDDAAAVPSDDIGRWDLSADGARLTLHGGREAPVVFAVQNSHLLTRLGPGGSPLYPDGESELNRAAACVALQPRLLLAGSFRYLADAAVFDECLTGQRIPVAMEADFPALERAYLTAIAETDAEPGSPLHVTVEGSLAQRPVVDGEGMRRTLVVERLIGVWPADGCPKAQLKQ